MASNGVFTSFTGTKKTEYFQTLTAGSSSLTNFDNSGPSSSPFIVSFINTAITATGSTGANEISLVSSQTGPNSMYSQLAPGTYIVNNIVVTNIGAGVQVNSLTIQVGLDVLNPVVGASTSFQNLLGINSISTPSNFAAGASVSRVSSVPSVNVSAPVQYVNCKIVSGSVGTPSSLTQPMQVDINMSKLF